MSISPSHLLTKSIAIACSSPYFMHLGNFWFSAHYFPQCRDHENIALLAPSGSASTQHRLSFSKVSWSVGFNGIITASKFRYGRHLNHSQCLEATRLMVCRSPLWCSTSADDVWRCYKCAQQLFVQLLSRSKILTVGFRFAVHRTKLCFELGRCATGPYASVRMDVHL